jgi:hypothetical protein
MTLRPRLKRFQYTTGKKKNSRAEDRISSPIQAQL